jgi:hypothetical protein
MESKNNLLPCPFCGAGARKNGNLVTCSSIGCGMEEDAMAKDSWQRRVLPAVFESEEALRAKLFAWWPKAEFSDEGFLSTQDQFIDARTNHSGTIDLEGHFLPEQLRVIADYFEEGR